MPQKYVFAVEWKASGREVLCTSVLVTGRENDGTLAFLTISLSG
jgi:hypothetical protein